MVKIVGLVAVIVGLAAATIAVSAWEWGALGDTGMSTAGYVSLAVGAVVATIVGCGLMGLIFYSSRRGYDESPQLENDADLHRDAATRT
jgi:uncharacterized membrane protein